MYPDSASLNVSFFDIAPVLVSLTIIVLFVVGTIMEIVAFRRRYYRMESALQRIIDEQTTPDGIRQQARKALGEKPGDSLNRRRAVLSDLKEDEDIPSSIRTVAARELEVITDDD